MRGWGESSAFGKKIKRPLGETPLPKKTRGLPKRVSQKGEGPPKKDRGLPKRDRPPQKRGRVPQKRGRVSPKGKGLPKKGEGSPKKGQGSPQKGQASPKKGRLSPLSATGSPLSRHPLRRRGLSQKRRTVPPIHSVSSGQSQGLPATGWPFRGANPPPGPASLLSGHLRFSSTTVSGVSR